VATAKDDQNPIGPQGPLTPSVEWLILQRLDDLRRAQDDLRADMKALETQLDTQINKLDTDMKALETQLDTQINKLDADMKALETQLDTQINKLDAKIDSLRTWSLGLLLLAILGLLAKLLIPGA